MRLTMLYATFLLVALLSGCAASGIEIVDLGCFWTAPIRVADADILTDGTAKQMLAHNQAWNEHCLF
ncbi:hypothetical protein H0A64_07200 [Alcaligenaceae bacterium]|nr:hypothetical protein [Alcaligenaceae bacterium]